MKTMGIKHRISALLFLFISVGAVSQSLDGYLQLAVENNPSLKAAHLKYEAALEVAPQVGGLPDPTLTVSAFGTPMTTDMGEERASFELMQMFPWFGTLEARKEVASLTAEAAYFTYVSEKEQLFLDIKKAYAELYQAQKSIQFQQENLNILDTYYDLAMSKFRSGLSPMVNVVRVEIAQDAARTQLTLLEESTAPLRATFNLLLNRDVAATISLQDTLELQSMELSDAEPSFRDHPSLQQLEKQQQSYETQKKVVQKEGLPGFGLGVGYMINAKSSMGMPDMNGNDAIMPMLSVSLPIFRKKYNASKHQAELMVQSVQLEQQQQQNQFRSQFHQQQYELNKAKQLLELYQRQIESSDRARTLLVSSFSSNTGDFEEILRMNQDILIFRLQRLEALKSGFIAQATIGYLLTSEFIEKQKN
jgi:outer membrane protein TolC